MLIKQWVCDLCGDEKTPESCERLKFGKLGTTVVGIIETTIAFCHTSNNQASEVAICQHCKSALKKALCEK